MPSIIIENMHGKEVDFSGREQALKIFQDSFIDWMHACGGKGRCTTCKMIIVQGKDYLSPLSPFEKKCAQNGLLKDQERLACQCAVSNNIVVKVPDENKLPHIDYSE